MSIRYQAGVPNHRAIFPAVVGLAGVLALEGKLSDAKWATWRSGNDWFNAAYPDPAASNPDVYNSQVNPSAATWFKDTATHLLERVEPHLKFLERHGLEVVRLASDDPGRIIYEDTGQIVVVPHEYIN